MTVKRFWIGSLGPYFYDDTEDVIDPDAVVVEKQAGIVSEGVIKALTAPADPEDVLRLSDLVGVIYAVSVTNIDDPSPELNTEAGSAAGTILVAYEAAAGVDEFTCYYYDPSSTTAENVPYTVDGSS